MAKAGKLGKLLKKMQSIGKASSSTTTNRSTVAAASNSIESSNLIPVYVGQTRRRYMVSAEVVGHPLFQELVIDSGYGEEVSVGCEVVLFEHLLWMLDNADPQPESLDELVDFYAC
ncbi:auxin-responsive protein SAUR76 [Silene latifolia]|uniref:auxin-responsive protein SAUR76 n=1 Tax=Silene latifolia TaxID=37657 RepID=UPI003D7778AA